MTDQPIDTLQPGGKLVKPKALCAGCGMTVVFEDVPHVFGKPMAKPLQEPRYYCKWCGEDFNVTNIEVIR